eukprot:scaffold301430_cov14-Prasinocladus_malaysianus.AAC.1
MAGLLSSADQARLCNSARNRRADHWGVLRYWAAPREGRGVPAGPGCPGSPWPGGRTPAICFFHQ